MKTNTAFTIIISLIFGISFPTAKPLFSQSKPVFPNAAPKTQGNAANAKFALLIGVNDYADKNIPDLEGCENDVRLMTELLSEIYGFKPETDIKQMLSSSTDEARKPTRKAILEQFDKHLLENAKAYLKSKNLQPEKDAGQGAAIVFYYSGHGSHLPDNENKDETDGEDETIVPMDSDAKGSNDIRDDEFELRFRELKKYTSNITFIFDSCHSGTVTRGSGERSLKRSPFAGNTRGGENEAALNENMDAAGESYVTISGSLPNQKAQEKKLPNLNEMRRKIAAPREDVNGYLTYYLAQTLREMPGATYRDVMKRVSVAVQKRNPGQTPQVEGDVDRTVFGAASTSKKNRIEVTNIRKEGNAAVLTINAGKIVGAYPGGAAAIYKQFGDAERFAVGEIIEPTDDFKATVRVEEGKEIGENAGIVLATPFFGSSRRNVALDTTLKRNVSEKDDAGVSMINRLSSKLEKSDFVAARKMANPFAAANLEKWDVALVRATWKKFKEGNRQPSVKNTETLPQDADEIYYIASRNDRPLYNFWVTADDPKADQKIEIALERFVRVENLRALGNENSELGSGLELKLVKVKTLNDPPRSRSDLVENGILRESFLTAGDYFSFEVFNKTGTPLFVYVYSIGTDGAVDLLYEPKTDGDKLANNVTFKALSSGVLARSALPVGVETFKMIAATQRFDGRLLTSPAIARTRSIGGSPLEALLAQATTNTRNSELITFEFSGWTATNLNVEIIEKK